VPAQKTKDLKEVDFYKGTLDIAHNYKKRVRRRIQQVPFNVLYGFSKDAWVDVIK
jgi:hypothetical protein